MTCVTTENVGDLKINADTRQAIMGEIVIRGFDFSKRREIKDGATVSSAVVTATPSGLTIGVPQVSSPYVDVQITLPVAGTAHKVFTVRCVATLSTGARLVGIGPLDAKDCPET